MKCPKCGKEIADDSNFCEFCGVKISQQRCFKVLWIVLLFLLGLSVLGVGSFYVYDSHRRYVKDVAEAKAAQEDAERQAEKARLDSIIASYRAQQWVDLGLPSGTLWKDKNAAGGFYTYDQAVEKFWNSLPTKEQLEELKTSCRWTWTGNGYKVEGPSGASIFLPAAGYRDYDGTSINGIGLYGAYWSSTPNGPTCAWGLAFDSSIVDKDSAARCHGFSVRLVRRLNKYSSRRIH